MKFKFAALPLMIFTVSAAAESYQSISEANYRNIENPVSDIDVLDLDTAYYFSPLETRGPLKEFDYIIKSSDVFAKYNYEDFDDGDIDTLEVGGDYFADNGLVVGGSYTDSGDLAQHTVSAGYLFTPGFLAQVRREKAEDSDAIYFADLRYNHELGGSDYIGFNFVTDDDFDYRELTSKFFKELPGQTWLVLKGGYASIDGAENNWNLGGEYYFSKKISVNVDYNKAETIELGFSHFFNRNVASKLAYTTNKDTDIDTLLLELTMQL